MSCKKIENFIFDGGPAFPRPAFTPGLSFHDSAATAGFASTAREGMSLRDYFAAAALQGILMNYTTEKFGATEQTVAQYAYRYADAMLDERGKEAQP